MFGYFSRPVLYKNVKKKKMLKANETKLFVFQRGVIVSGGSTMFKKANYFRTKTVSK